MEQVFENDTKARAQALGRRLKEYREALGITQYEAERRSGVRREYIGSIEIGRIAVIYPEPFNALKRLYGFPGWEILELMGYETDAGSPGVHPSLIAALKGVPLEQQERMLPAIRGLVRSVI